MLCRLGTMGFHGEEHKRSKAGQVMLGYDNSFNYVFQRDTGAGKVPWWNGDQTIIEVVAWGGARADCSR
jgi:hypothetical protein